MKNQHPILLKIRNVLNTFVLIGAIVIITTLSIEIFGSHDKVSETTFMQIQLWICAIFMADFFFRFYLSAHKLQYIAANFIFFIISIPFLNIAHYMNLQLSAEAYYILKLMPLIRGGYGLAIMVGWITRSRLSSLLLSYVIAIISVAYFSSLIFYSVEQNVNNMVTSFGSAVWWALMNLTTVGSNIYAVTTIGKFLSVLLAASGMMMFPIFTAYITDKFQSRSKKSEKMGNEGSSSTVTLKKKV